MSLFDLNDSSSIPLWVQMKNRFIHLITSGYYKAGDKLPTVRGLAAEIEVNYNTVSKVYQSLEADGYIESKRRQGAFVCDVSGRPGVSASLTAVNVTREYFQRCLELGMSLDDVEQVFYEVLADSRANGSEGENDESAGRSQDQGPGREQIIDFGRIQGSRRATS